MKESGGKGIENKDGERNYFRNGSQRRPPWRGDILSRDLIDGKDEANWTPEKKILDRRELKCKALRQEWDWHIRGIVKRPEWQEVSEQREERRAQSSTLAQEFPAYSSLSPYNTPGRWVGRVGAGRWEVWKEGGRFIHSPNKYFLSAF